MHLLPPARPPGRYRIDLVSYAAPVFAGVSGWVVLGETLDGTAVAGFLVIFVGFALLKRRALRKGLGTLRQALADSQTN